MKPPADQPRRAQTVPSGERSAQVAGSADGVIAAEGEVAVPAAPMRPWRLGVVALVLCALFGGVIARAHHLQVGQSEDLAREARAQVDGAIEIQARRGAIYDREGREMALSVRAESIVARPRLVTSPREAAAALSRLLGQPEVELFQRLTADSNFVWLSRRISPQIAERVRALELAGIDTMPEWQRYYPMRQRAGHVVGFTGDDGYGLEGIERTLEGVLAGGSMEVRGLRDALGRPILSTESPELEAMEGASIVLSLDSRIQRIAERELERVIHEEQATTGVIIVVDPETGELLALTSWPPFDPNRFRTLSAEVWRNRSITDAWEPGSTMKVFTYAAALDAGVLAPNDMLDTGGGRIQIGRHRIRDHVRATVMRAWEVIQQSSNIGTYRMAQLLGDRGLYEAFRRFGFGQATGIDLGGEQAGLLAEPPWAEVELANRAFGQGVSATPLQMTMAYAALANGGELMEPLLVLEVRNKDGDTIRRNEPRVVRRVASERTVRQVVAAMEAVTGDDGTGSLARVPGIDVAGKTGTAQMVNPETGLYDDLWMASFIGFVPADDPEFTIAVMVEEPQVGHYGGEVAGPVFARVAEQALATRGIFAEPGDADVADAEDGDEQRADAAVADHGAITAENAWVDATHTATTLSLSPLPVGFDGRPARVTLPDLRGSNLAELLAVTESLGLGVEVTGWGTVQRQWPAPGASVLQGSAVEVYLAAPYELGHDEPEPPGGAGDDEAARLDDDSDARAASPNAVAAGGIE